MNHWVYRPTPVSEQEIESAISNRGRHAARDPATGEWYWVHVVKNSPVTFKRGRRCAAEEVSVLNGLLKGEIVCRMRRDTRGVAWAFASRA